MTRDELKKRIGELCSKVMAETNPDLLGKYCQELEAMVEIYRSNVEYQNPPPSKLLAEAERLYKPTAEDLMWAWSTVNLLSEGGVLGIPAAGLIYKLDKKRKTMTLQNVSQLSDFDAFVTHLQTIVTFKDIGWTVNEKE